MICDDFSDPSKAAISYIFSKFVSLPSMYKKFGIKEEEKIIIFLIRGFFTDYSTKSIRNDRFVSFAFDSTDASFDIYYVILTIKNEFILKFMKS